MSIKEKLCEVLQEYISSNNMTYDKVEESTCLSRSQVYNVVKNNGKTVSSDKIESALIELGVDIVITAYN